MCQKCKGGGGGGGGGAGEEIREGRGDFVLSSPPLPFFAPAT